LRLKDLGVVPTMKNFLTFGVTGVLLTVLASTAFGQSGGADVGIRANLAGGEIISLEGGKMVVSTIDGQIDVIISANTEFKKVAPENPSLRAASVTTAGDISVGDRVLVSGQVSEDRKSVPARTVYLISKNDIEERRRRETEEWRTRGITGRITTYNPQTQALTVSIRGLMGETTVTVIPKEGVEYLRYAPDSVEFSQAKRSSFNEIAPGDSLRALGSRNADGTEFVAEKIVTGAFVTVGGTITAVDEQKGEIMVNEVGTNRAVTVIVSKGAVLRQFPAEMVQRFTGGAAMPTGAGATVIRPPQAGQSRPSGAPGGGTRGSSSQGLDDLFDRFPGIGLGDLKVGQMIAVSSSKGADSSRVNAIKLLSGVEAFLRAPQGGRRPSMGEGDPGFTIPGLDGFGF
jgi:hypothetical protein